MIPKDRTARETLEAKVLDTVKVVLIQIFEEQSADQVFQILKEQYGLEGGEILKKSHVLSQVFLNLFGKGAMIIEDLILEKIYTELKIPYKWKENYTFSNYIEDLTLTPCLA
jgi:LytS/YehU family sensor histidine kinase